MPDAGTHAGTAAFVTIFNRDGGLPGYFWVKNRDTSTADAELRVTPQHNGGGTYKLEPGVGIPIRRPSLVEHQGVGSTVEYSPL